MPQNEHIELAQKRYGKRLDHAEKTRKKEAREVHTRSLIARRSHGLRAKLINEKRRKEKKHPEKGTSANEVQGTYLFVNLFAMARLTNGEAPAATRGKRGDWKFLSAWPSAGRMH